MTPERWRRVKDLLASALDREGDDREAFLEEACAEDASLRREVETLLASDEAAAALLERPAFEVEEAEVPTLSPGTRLGPYEVVALLGVGGMGEVYRARDARLGREVAVKVLPRAFSKDRERLKRFEHEARAASALNHPNVVTIFDVGSTAGIPYAVSELLEGETLRARLAAGPLAVRDALRLARDVAAGLRAAHERGIVHRDLKPENLFVTRDGRVKILDFGLAKQMEPGPPEASTATLRTHPGMVLGTVGYMSPEQVRGLPADHRSDIFSFGAMLYELLTGRRAFPGDAQADALSAILRDEPPPASESNPEVPPELDALVERCLRKRPQERFQAARELADALEAVVPALERPLARRQRSIAVLPFRDLSGDPDTAHLGLGLADATITELAHLRSLVVRPTSAVIRYQEQPTDPQRAARDLGVDAVVEGSFQRAGQRLRVTARLLDAKDGRSLWADKIDASLDDIFGMQDEVSRSVARALEVELTPSDERRLAARGREKRPSPEVYELYLKGKLHLLRGTLSDLVAAVDWFEKAREADSGYALAWVGLANAYSRIGFTFQPDGDWYARAQAACEKALSLDPSLPEGRHVRALLRWSPQGGFDHAGAIRDLIAAIQGRPGLEDAYRRLAGVLYHVGLLEEAQEELERALTLSPDYPFAWQHVGFCRYQQGRYAEALEITEDTGRRVPEPFSFYQTAVCQLRLGRLEDAARTAEVLSLHFPDDVLAHPLLGVIAALRGDAAEALKQVDLTVRHKKAFGHYHHAQYEVACIHALLGRRDEALTWLTEAAHNGYPCAVFFERDELLSSLRGDERFERLMAELRDESDRYLRLYRELRRRSQGQTPAEGHPPRSVAPSGARLMLAVLPFENLGGEAGQEYFSEGLTEELITQLGRLNAERLGVIARTSAMSYKGTRKSVEQVGRELGVGYILEGSVRGAGGRLRVAAQLVQVRDQTQLWADSYDRELTDVLSVQAELGRAVARQIGVLLAPSAERTPHAVDPAAYLAYLKGRYCWNKRTTESLQSGIEFFEEAIRVDPAYAAAYAGLADSYLLLGDVGVAALRPREAFAKAREAATRALELEEALAEAHASLAHIRLHEFHWADAEEGFRRALELDPNYATACHWYAMFLAAMGRHSEAMAMMRRARELDPLSPAINTDVGVLFYYARDFDRAIDEHRATLEMHPEFARAWVTLGSACAQMGLHDEAVAALRKAVALSADAAKKAALARVCAAAGLKDEALAILGGLEELFLRSQLAPYPIALVHAALGNRDEAFAWLQKAREEGAPEIVFLKVDPWLDDLRPEPRFVELLRSVGLR